jgi:hypothetical protein
MVKLSIIIVSYKKLDILIDCVESIIEYNDMIESTETIIVDNSPGDNIAIFFANNYPSVVFIRNENKGFGQANNVGAAIAKGEYLLFLNPDTILIEPIFKFAVSKFEENDKLGLFGMKLIDSSLNANMSFFMIDGFGTIMKQIEKIASKLDIFIDGKMFISGADMFIRKVDFMEAGRFDDNIFMYCEEMDLIKRIKRLGRKTCYFNERRIIHLEGKTSTDSDLSLKRRLDSTMYYCEKYRMDFKKFIISEIRYLKLKKMIYIILNNEVRKKDMNNQINIHLKYLIN